MRSDFRQSTNSPTRLLLVEETGDIQKIIQVGLELIAGFQVVSVNSYEAWLSQAHLDCPDLILLDTPPKSEYRLLQFYQHSEPHNIPIICMVARDRFQDRLQATTQGAAAVIAKPFDLLVLAQLISKTLAQYSQDSLL